MNDKKSTGDDGAGRIMRLWHLLIRPNATTALGTILAAGVVWGILFWGGFSWAMELPNTEEFCISCHEMERNVFREYKRTIHHTNRTGVRATCPDCHVPKTWVHKVARKIRATNELFHHFAGTIDTREKYEAKRLELTTTVWESMVETDSRECRNCRSFQYMDFTTQEKRSMERHDDAEKKGQTCIECHKGIAHELPAGTFEREGRINGRNHSG